MRAWFRRTSWTMTSFFRRSSFSWRMLFFVNIATITTNITTVNDNSSIIIIVIYMQYLRLIDFAAKVDNLVRTGNSADKIT